LRKIIINDEPVFFLHIRKYSETSVILDCFSQQYGRFSVLGKGLLSTRKRNTKERPRLFQAYRVNASLRTELGTLMGIESNHIWIQPKAQKWYVANYLNEILIRFLPQLESVPQLYQQYVKTLNCLTQDIEYSYELLIFEKILLESLGYGINLEYESKTRDLINSYMYYSYDPLTGFVQCDEDYNYAVQGNIILALQLENSSFFSQENMALRSAKRIIRMALKYHLGDVKLKTIEVHREVGHFTENLS